MRGSRKSAISTFATLVILLGGCATAPWQSPKSSAPTARPVVAVEPASAPSASPEQPRPMETAMVTQSADAFSERPELRDVRFRPGQVGVVKADHKALDMVVRWMKEHRSAVLMLEGHTDDQGTREGNLVAGEKRADAIRTYLVQNEIEPNRIAVTSAGAERPVCSEKTDACRAKNRRVRFLVK